MPQHGHVFDCATCSVTSGGGAGLMSVTWWRRCAKISCPDRSAPHPRHSAGGYQNRCAGSSTRRIVVPGSPGCFPGARFPFSRSDRSRGFFLYGLSDDGGFDDVEESFPARRSRASTRAASRPFSATASSTRAAISRTWAVSCAITRYASASRSASTPCGRTASSSADGRPGSSGTARHHATTTARQPPETANRNYPVTSNNTLTLAE